MTPIVLRMVLAGFIAGTALPGLAATLESSTPVPPELFADQGETLVLVVQEEQPAEAAPTGTIDPKAMILPLSMNGEGLEPEIFWCAIDRSAPGAGFDVLRIDTCRTGSFKNAEILKLKPAADGTKDLWEFSGIIQVKAAARTIPCLANGMINGPFEKTVKKDPEQEQEIPFVMVSIIHFATAKLDINGKTYRIAVGDGNGDGDLADAARLAKKTYPGQPEGKKAGDFFAIDLDGNGFKGRNLKGYLGVPFCLDGHWLVLKTNEKATDLTAEAQADPGTGTLDIPAGVRLEALISGGRSLFPIIDGQPPVPLKAGKYRIVEARLLGPGKTTCELMPEETETAFEIADGVKTAFPVPHQIKMEVSAECEDVGPVRLIRMGLKMTSDNGAKIGVVTAADGSQPTPTVKILDPQGKVVHTGKFEFG